MTEDTASDAAPVASGATARHGTAVVEASPHPILALRPDGTIDLWNDAAADVFGYSAAEALGERIQDLDIHPADTAAEFTARFRQAMAGETVRGLDVERQTRDGEPIQLRLSTAPLRDDDGEIAGVVTIAEDVTEQNERETELRERQASYQRLTERITEGFYAVDTDWTVTFWNDEVAERVGIPAEAVVGEHLWEVFAEVEDTVYGETLRRALATGEARSCEFHFEEEDYWVQIDAYPDEEGLAVISTDVTDRKRRMESILEGAPVLLFTLDPAGVITESRGRTLATLGLEPGEAVGISAYDMYGQFDHVVDALDRALAGEELRTTIDLGEVVLETQFSPRVEDGEVVEVVGVAMDVTELERRREQIAHINEAGDELLGTTDPAESASLIVATAAEVLDEEVVGFWAHDAEEEALLPAQLTPGLAELAAAGKGPMRITPGSWEWGAFEHGELRHTADYDTVARPAVEDTPAESVMLVPLGDHGLLGVATPEPGGFPDAEVEVVRLLASTATAALDAAERETALEVYKDQLERSNERLQEFAYVASHDLQEPLRMVSSYISLLEDDYGDQLDAEALEYMDFAVDGAERMQAMVDGLLEYARVQTRAEEFTETDAEAVLEHVRQDLAMHIADHDATITHDPLPRVEADPDQLGQLLQNLVKNAIEHGGESPSVHVSAEAQEGAYRFSVSDDGPGIPPDQLDRLFQLFQQGSRDGGGTGIGLAVCERIVDRHGGDIWVADDDADGATISFTIPDRSGEVPIAVAAEWGGQ